MDTAVDILATSEIALLGRMLAEVIERHGAGLTQFAEEEVSQRRQLRCVGLGLRGTALGLSLRHGTLRRVGLGQRRVPIRFSRRRWTALLYGLRRWTPLVFSLGHRPTVMLGLRRRTAMGLGLRGRAAMGLGARRCRPMVAVIFSRRTAMRRRVRSQMTGMLGLRLWAALVFDLWRWVAIGLGLGRCRPVVTVILSHRTGLTLGLADRMT